MHEENEENHQKPQSRVLVSWSKYKCGGSQTQSSNATQSSITFDVGLL